jgi:D-beta-D-heptose 7-phosphate kinase/D-beta-D-heptose 1-phosphate adenosyltransferase
MALSFSESKVLIIGDIILDKYYFGNVERISPEAPVPIVNIKKEENRLGGASNVANNISNLGGEAFLCGTIGHDFFGKEIERQAREKNIRTSLIKTNLPTITKARIIGGKQQIVRLDYEEKICLNPSEEKQIQEIIVGNMANYNVLVISDYGKGTISDTTCRFLIREAKNNHTYCIIDPKGSNWDKYAGADIITPNLKELSDIIGYRVDNEDAEVEKAAKQIISEKNLSSLLVTRSDKGMSLITSTQSFHIPTHSEEVFDVSGAGDTVVATLSMCLSIGMDTVKAMKIANTAAGIVVKKIGTATLSIEELNKTMVND